MRCGARLALAVPTWWPHRRRRLPSSACVQGFELPGSMRPSWRKHLDAPHRGGGFPCGGPGSLPPGCRLTPTAGMAHSPN